MSKFIDILGNSHVRNFIGHGTEPDKTYYRKFGEKELRATQVGSTGATIYGLKNSNSETQAGRKIVEYVQTYKPSCLIMVLGDVDIREHIHRHPPFGETVKDLLARYEEFLTFEVAPNVQQLMLSECLPFPFKYCSKPDNIDKPIVWSRVLFNRGLKEMCDRKNWTYISYPKCVVETDGMLKPQYWGNNDVDDIHMNHEAIYPMMVAELMFHLED